MEITIEILRDWVASLDKDVIEEIRNETGLSSIPWTFGEAAIAYRHFHKSTKDV